MAIWAGPGECVRESVVRRRAQCLTATDASVGNGPVPVRTRVVDCSRNLTGGMDGLGRLLGQSKPGRFDHCSESPISVTLQRISVVRGDEEFPAGGLLRVDRDGVEVQRFSQ